MMRTSRALAIALVIPLALRASAQEASADGHSQNANLARQIRDDAMLKQVDQMARKLLASGFNAGGGYSEVWIRDLNTFIELALKVNPPGPLRASLLSFAKLQGEDGDIVDGYVSADTANGGYAYRKSPLAPGLAAHKNTVESDQESSLVQAVCKYVSVTGDRTILQERIGQTTMQDRLGHALRYILHARFDEPHGLVWGATRADWGDVQPESDWGVVVDEKSHRALCIYDNAMFLIAVDDYLKLIGSDAQEVDYWKSVEHDLRNNIRKHLWDANRRKFIPHVYLAGSPFPDSFDEDVIYYHGGTAVAIEAGLLTGDEVLEALQRMRQDVKDAKASSIGLTMYPPYPRGFFRNPGMTPYSYQNGGDWCWFGGRFVHELIRLGYIDDAYRELRPMVERVQRTGGFHEWWTPENQPRGSDQFRGSAGVLGEDIELLQAWAGGQQTQPGTSR